MQICTEMGFIRNKTSQLGDLKAHHESFREKVFAKRQRISAVPATIQRIAGEFRHGSARFNTKISESKKKLMKPTPKTRDKRQSYLNSSPDKADADLFFRR